MTTFTALGVLAALACLATAGVAAGAAPPPSKPCPFPARAHHYASTIECRCRAGCEGVSVSMVPYGRIPKFVELISSGCMRRGCCSGRIWGVLPRMEFGERTALTYWNGGFFVGSKFRANNVRVVRVRCGFIGSVPPFVQQPV